MTELKVQLIAHTLEPLKTVASAAKLCYSPVGVDEIQEGLTDDKASKFVQHLADIGHCYDDKTEVLTDTGFKLWKDVNEHDLIASFNPNDRTFNEFEKPIRLIIQDKINEDMIKFSHKRGDLVITTGHNLYCSISNTQYKRSNPVYELIPANKILTTGKKVYESPIRMSTCATNPNKTSYDDDIWYSLFGFFIGDGYIHSTATEKSKRLKFHLKKDRKVKYLKNICNECGIELEEIANNTYNVVLKNSKYNAKFFKDSFYNENNEKTFPTEFFKMSENQYKLFLEGLLMSDGNYATQGKNNVYYTKSDELANRLQTLTALNNKMCTITKAPNVCNRVYISRDRLKNIMYNDSRLPAKVEIIKYTGKVYCATVSTGLIMVRRNGFICLCGNCSPLEHAAFTFAIEGISRACSHQFVRHRIASFSQQSQRYVKLDQFEYIIPPAIAANKHTKVRYIRHMEQTQELYDDLRRVLILSYFEEQYNSTFYEYEELWNKMSMDEQKKYRYLFLELLRTNYPKTIRELEKKAIEDARYVLPNACETKMVITMNTRSLYNLFKHRLCNRSQWEIREVAEQMLECVKSVAPELFTNIAPSCVHGKCPEGNMSCGKAAIMKEKYL